MNRLLIYFCAFTIGIATIMPLGAQESSRILLKDVYVSSPLTITGTNEANQSYNVKLWGIQLIDQDRKIATKTVLEKGIAGGLVSCTLKNSEESENLIGQCIGRNENDLALVLLQQGYAIADKGIIQGSIFEDLYGNAESQAIESRSGLWQIMLPNEQSLVNTMATDQRFELTENMAHFFIAAMILGPFIGMLLVAFIIYGGFRRLIYLQKYQMAMAHKRDRAMREREKFIVAASLEGELNTNRAKVDAFIIIYEQMLKNLRDPLKDHKYKKGGDIIHQKPALSRNVYDSNTDKLDLLGANLVADITHLYIDIDPNPDYKTIEPNTPIEEVIDYVSTIIRDAESMVPKMDAISSALNVIVRDRRAKTGKSI